MTTDSSGNYRVLIIVLLVAVIVVGGVVAWARYSPAQPVEIFIPPETEPAGEIYVGGMVANPGIYPLREGDSLADIIRAAGGATGEAGPGRLELYVLEPGQEAELELVRQRAGLASTVLKVAHHGSATSTAPEFLAVVDPQLAVIPVGADNPYGHPTDEVMARLEDRLGRENIYRTDERGTVTFVSDGERLWVRTGG